MCEYSADEKYTSAERRLLRFARRRVDDLNDFIEMRVEQGTYNLLLDNYRSTQIEPIRTDDGAILIADNGQPAFGQKEEVPSELLKATHSFVEDDDDLFDRIIAAANKARTAGIGDADADQQLHCAVAKYFYFKWGTPA